MFLRPVLAAVAAYITATLRSYVVNSFYLVGVLGYTAQGHGLSAAF